MDEMSVVIVLGKRLVNDALTAEGRSRVEALVQSLASGRLAHNVTIAFCGGITQGQTVSEAQAMFAYFTQLCEQKPVGVCSEQILLEERSTSTVENILEVSQVLIRSGKCLQGAKLVATFVSNDYHLKRIFEIQQLMDEQGLLKVLRERCAERGIILDISYQLDDHIGVPYPHRGLEAQLFLLIDELTTYRVYLEGVARGVFTRPLAQVRAIPYQRAMVALEKIGQILPTQPSFSTHAYDFARLQQWIEASGSEQSRESVAQIATQFHRTLIRLNRHLDPEREQPNF